MKKTTVKGARAQAEVRGAGRGKGVTSVSDGNKSKTLESEGISRKRAAECEKLAALAKSGDLDRPKKKTTTEALRSPANLVVGAGAMNEGETLAAAIRRQASWLVFFAKELDQSDYMSLDGASSAMAHANRNMAHVAEMLLLLAHEAEMPGVGA